MLILNYRQMFILSTDLAYLGFFKNQNQAFITTGHLRLSKNVQHQNSLSLNRFYAIQNPRLVIGHPVFQAL